MQRITPPMLPAVDLAPLKAHLRIDEDHEDGHLRHLIEVATEQVETRLSRQLVMATWSFTLPKWPRSGMVELTRPPIAAVTEVRYWDAAGVEQTLAPAADWYRTRADVEPGQLVFLPNVVFPDHDDRDDAITVEFMAGYGDSANDVPSSIRHAIMVLAAHYYAMREPVVAGTTVAKIPDNLDALIGSASWGRWP